MSDAPALPPVDHKPRLDYADFKDQPIGCRLIDGNDIAGTVVDLWMSDQGHPLMFRVASQRGLIDIPWTSVVHIDAQPALSDGWIGPDRLSEGPVGCRTWADGRGHVWWKPA